MGPQIIAGRAHSVLIALQLLNIAAEAGVLHAAYNLAVAYDESYYRQAAHLGSAEARHAVGSRVPWGGVIKSKWAAEPTPGPLLAS
jgi:hypothetical protein